MGKEGLVGSRGERGLTGAEVGERSDAAASRRRILTAARELFEEKGVNAASMHEVGRRAGVGQGTLYRRFEHKGALCSALIREEADLFLSEARARVARRGESALSGVGWLLERLAEFNEENGQLLGAMRDAAGGDRRVEMYRNPFYGGLREVAAAMLGRAVAEGEADPDLDVECAADAVLAALNIDLYQFQREEEGMGRDRIVRALRDLYLDGLRRGDGREN